MKAGLHSPSSELCQLQLRVLNNGWFRNLWIQNNKKAWQYEACNYEQIKWLLQLTTGKMFSAPNRNVFNNRLGRYCKDQKVKIGWKALLSMWHNTKLKAAAFSDSERDNTKLLKIMQIQIYIYHLPCKSL